MIITKELTNNSGSCCFCCRGKLLKSRIGLKFPYRLIYVLRGNSIAITICEECIKIIKQFKAK